VSRPGLEGGEGRAYVRGWGTVAKGGENGTVGGERDGDNHPLLLLPEGVQTRSRALTTQEKSCRKGKTGKRE